LQADILRAAVPAVVRILVVYDRGRPKTAVAIGCGRMMQCHTFSKRLSRDWRQGSGSASTMSLPTLIEAL